MNEDLDYIMRKTAEDMVIDKLCAESRQRVPINTTINAEFDEKVRQLLAREDVNRKLIKGLSQRLDRLERGAPSPPSTTDLTPARRPEEV